MFWQFMAFSKWLLSGFESQTSVRILQSRIAHGHLAVPSSFVPACKHAERSILTSSPPAGPYCSRLIPPTPKISALSSQTLISQQLELRGGWGRVGVGGCDKALFGAVRATLAEGRRHLTPALGAPLTAPPLRAASWFRRLLQLSSSEQELPGVRTGDSQHSPTAAPTPDRGPSRGEQYLPPSPEAQRQQLPSSRAVLGRAGAGQVGRGWDGRSPSSSALLAGPEPPRPVGPLLNPELCPPPPASVLFCLSRCQSVCGDRLGVEQ